MTFTSGNPMQFPQIPTGPGMGVVWDPDDHIYRNNPVTFDASGSMILSGNLLFSPDNTYDIGASGSNRPRNVYVAGTVNVGPTNASAASGDLVVARDATHGAIFFGTGGQYLFFNANTFTFAAGGITFAADNTFDIGANGGTRPRDLYLGSRLVLGASTISILQDDGGNTLAQRNGTNAQTFRIYNTYTDASNYERLDFLWSGNVVYIRPWNAGTGVARDLRIGGTLSTYIGGGGTFWQFFTDGTLRAPGDNLYDIGASGASRPRNIYAGGGHYLGNTTATQGGALFGGSGVPAAGLGANGDVYFRSDGGAGTTMYQKRAGAWVATAA
jgi:hypothetical protein